MHLSILIAISYTLFIKFKIVPRGTKAASWMDEGGAAFFTCNRKSSSQTMYSVERASFWKHKKKKNSLKITTGGNVPPPNY